MVLVSRAVCRRHRHYPPAEVCIFRVGKGAALITAQKPSQWCRPNHGLVLEKVHLTASQSLAYGAPTAEAAGASGTFQQQAGFTNGVAEFVKGLAARPATYCRGPASPPNWPGTAVHRGGEQRLEQLLPGLPQWLLGVWDASAGPHRRRQHRVLQPSTSVEQLVLVDGQLPECLPVRRQLWGRVRPAV